MYIFLKHIFTILTANFDFCGHETYNPDAIFSRLPKYIHRNFKMFIMNKSHDALKRKTK